MASISSRVSSYSQILAGQMKLSAAAELLRLGQQSGSPRVISRANNVADSAASAVRRAVQDGTTLGRTIDVVA